MNSHPERKLTIIGAGIVGYLEAYYAFRKASQNAEKIKITMYEKNYKISDTTAAHLVPSLTPWEILSVGLRGEELIKKFDLLFNQGDGIRVEDVPNINNSKETKNFKSALIAYGKDDEAYKYHTDQLLTLGEKSMRFWQDFYENGDEELRQVLKESHFEPCKEPRLENKTRGDGYRIDLICNVPNAHVKAEGMLETQRKVGYKQGAILSPSEVVKYNPYLADFCEQNSEENGWDKERQWKNNAVAIWCPGGCIDSATFLLKFHAYLEKKMGTYKNENDIEKNCFQVKYARKVVKITYEEQSKKINGLCFLYNPGVKRNKYQYDKTEYAFCPGEAVGTMKSLGFQEPPYARFAGASLRLNIKLTPEQVEKFRQFNYGMEIYYENVGVAFQGRLIKDVLIIGVAGTKAYYGDQPPSIQHVFLHDRNFLQLNIINDLFPECVSIALQRDTKGQKLTYADLVILRSLGVAQGWVDSRAVVYDGLPVLGSVRTLEGEIVPNAHVTTALGSGGVSFSHAAVKISQSHQDQDVDGFTKEILNSTNSSRNILKLRAKL